MNKDYNQFMSNNISQFKEGFVPKYQDIMSKALIGMKIASLGLSSQLAWGKKVHRPKFTVSGLAVRDVVRYSDRTMGSISDTDQYLQIDKQKSVDFAIDDWDKLQNGPLQIGEEAGKQAALKLRTYIDADILAETVNAAQSFDDGDIAGTAGNGIDLTPGTSGNIAKVFTNLLAKFQAYNVEDSNLKLVLDPYTLAIINQEIWGKNINLTDTTLKNGYAGSVMGFQTYMSNNLTYSAELALGTLPTANDTVTINGVVFKFVASVGTTAGNVLLETDGATSMANLISAINGTAGAGTKYVEVSAADRLKLDRITATNATTKITLKGVGTGRITVAETLTAAGDVWSKTMLHNYSGKTGGSDIVLQQNVKPEGRDEPKQKTTNMLTDVLYGIKTFDDGAAKMIDLKLKVQFLRGADLFGSPTEIINLQKYEHSN